MENIAETEKTESQFKSCETKVCRTIKQLLGFQFPSKGKIDELVRVLG